MVWVVGPAFKEIYNKSGNKHAYLIWGGRWAVSGKFSLSLVVFGRLGPLSLHCLINRVGVPSHCGILNIK